MTILTKLLSVTVTPGDWGTPGNPGSPAIPEFTYIVGYEVKSSGGTFFPMNWDEDHVPPQWVQGLTLGQTFTAIPIYKTWPATPAVPPTPGVPATPSEVLRSLAAGWDAGATSIGTLAGDGGVEFTAVNVVGSLIGLAYNYPKPGFAAIDYGLYQTKGSTYVVESGATVTAAIPYMPGDTFRIVRRKGVVTYYRNGAPFYSSATLTTNATMIVAGALYLSNDTIVDAKMAAAGATVECALQPLRTLAFSGNYATSTASLAPLETTITGRAVSTVGCSLEPLKTLTYAGTYNSSTAALPPLSSSITGFKVSGFSNASLESLETLVYKGNYSESKVKLAPLTGEAMTGAPVPAFSFSATVMPAMVGFVHGLTGEIGPAHVVLKPLRSISSDHNYVYSEAVFEPLQSYSGKYLPISGWAQMTLSGAFSLDGIATAQPANALTYTLRGMTLAAHGGAHASLTAPRMTLAISASIATVGRAALSMRAPTVYATGRAGGVAAAILTTFGEWQVRGYGGAVASFTLNDGFTVTATGRGGGLGRAELTMPLFELTATGTLRKVQSAAAVLEALRPGPSGQARLALSGFYLAAMGSAVVALDHEAYAVNLKAATPRPGRDPEVDYAVTRFSRFPFDRVVRYGDNYYGVGATGIFLLEGLNDDGAATAWKVRTALDDIGTTALKRPIAVYVNARMAEGATAVVVAGESEENEYLCQMQRGAASQNHRVLVGKGVRSTHYALELGDTTGGEALINSIDFKVDELTRSV